MNGVNKKIKMASSIGQLHVYQQTIQQKVCTLLQNNYINMGMTVTVDEFT
jgi:hypothetical protein